MTWCILVIRSLIASINSHIIELTSTKNEESWLEDEDRFLLLGMSFNLRVPVICHCFRESETIVRIISARKANEIEELDYWRRRS